MIVSAFILAVLLGQPRIQNQDCPREPVAAASIEGIVVRLGTNEPVGGVDVELTRIDGTPCAPSVDSAPRGGGIPAPPGGTRTPGSSVAPSEIQRLRTEPDGKFVFRNLKAGRYRLVSAGADGAYAPVEYGERDPYDVRGPQFSLGEGQALREVRLEMPLTGSIAGRVLDPDGLPMGHVNVRALNPQYRDGKRALNIVESVYTNERGEYRLFWLPPGEYFVAAKIEDPEWSSVRPYVVMPGRADAFSYTSETPFVTTRVTPDGEVVEETNVVVYNGGQTDPSLTNPIILESGATVSAVDIPMNAARVRARHIRGVLIDGMTGRPAAGVSVQAFPRDWTPNALVPAARTDERGAFDLSGAVWGSYTVYANQPATAQQPAAPATARQSTPSNSQRLPERRAQMIVSVPDGDVSVTIMTSPAVNVTGRVSIEGVARSDSNPELRNVGVVFLSSLANISAVPVLAHGEESRTSPNVKPDGTFSEQLFAADYRVFVTGIPASLYLKSIRMGGANLEDGVRLTGASADPVEVVLAADGGELSGHVMGRNSEPVSKAVVALVPELPSQRGRGDLYRVASSDSAGTFRLMSIPPGRYKLFAWEQAAPGAWQSPQFLQPYDELGKSIEVGASSKQEIEVAVLPIRK